MSKHSVDFLAKSTVLLAGHGSSRPGGDNPVHRLRQSIEATGTFAAVIDGYLKQPPLLDQVLPAVATEHLFVVPMLTGHGYITDELIPHALAEIGERTHIHMCEPIGCHPAIPGLFADFIGSVIDGNDLAQESVLALLAAHGNRRNPQNADQAKALSQATSDLCDGIAVQAAFIEEAPLISDWQAQSPTDNLIVWPFMMGGGRHGAEDVPAMIGLDPQHPDLVTLGADKPMAGPFKVGGRRIWYGRALGYEPALANLIIDLVRDAA